MDQRRKPKAPPEREFDRGGPPEDGADPTAPRSPNAETEPETRAAAGGTPIPEAAIERASKRAKVNAAALRDVFSQFLDEDAPFAEPAPIEPAPVTKKKRR